jgi:protein-disulfide isomerase
MRLLGLIYLAATIAAVAAASPALAFDPTRDTAAVRVPTGEPSASRSGPGGQRRAANPEAPGALAAGGQLAQVDETATLIAARRAEIFADRDSPVGGNPTGDVTIVEFFDYNCPYCRQVAPTLQEIERTDPNVRLIYKEFLILGPGSEFAARAALASHKQGKYIVFHRALMAYPGRVAEGATMEIAQAVGLDMERLKRDMEEPGIAVAIERNLDLAHALRIGTTPAFIINDAILHGAADLEAFQGMIAEARDQ